MAHEPLFMLGIDAASLPFIRKHAEALPNLHGLMSDGLVQELASTADYLSASVWPTFYSGRMPGDHGQYYPMQWDAAAQRYRRIYDPALRPKVQVQPFWHDLAHDGLDVIALDVAHVLDDDTAPGLQITNWSYQSSGAASASDTAVLDDLRRRFGRRPIGPEVPVAKSKKECVGIRKRLVEAVRRKGAAIRYLMDRPWEVFVAAFYEVHRAGHNLWPAESAFASSAEPGALLAVYVATDREIGNIRQKLTELHGDAYNLAVFSLHGLGPNRAQDHFLPEIMHRLNAAYLGDPVPKTTKPHAANAMAYLRRTLPAALQYRLAKALGERVQDSVVNRAQIGGRDWRRIPAFPLLSGGEGLIRLNIRGRERDGFFDDDDPALQSYVAWLCERLAEITVRGGGRLIDDVVLARDEYPGRRTDLLPDIVLRWGPDTPADRIASPAIGEIRDELATGRGGNHTEDAFMIARGSDRFLQSAERVSHIVELAGMARANFEAAAEAKLAAV